ncbi:MAG: hypothetical protein ACI9KE_005994 [Polyangiales bacterium]|jgi:hypothetical protein
MIGGWRIYKGSCLASQKIPLASTHESAGADVHTRNVRALRRYRRMPYSNKDNQPEPLHA